MLTGFLHDQDIKILTLAINIFICTLKVQSKTKNNNPTKCVVPSGRVDIYGGVSNGNLINAIKIRTKA